MWFWCELLGFRHVCLLLNIKELEGTQFHVGTIFFPPNYTHCLYHLTEESAHVLMVEKLANLASSVQEDGVNVYIPCC